MKSQVAGRLGYNNGASVAANFIEAGYEMVVFETRDSVDLFVAHFTPDQKVFLLIISYI